MLAFDTKLTVVKPRIAICMTLEQRPEDALALACAGNGCACVDFRLDAHALGSTSVAMDRLRATAEAVDVRFHYPLGPLDLSHGDPHEAERALASTLEACDVAESSDVHYLTVHLGLQHEVPAARLTAAVDRLAGLVDYGRARGVTVCLENLRWGLTSEPDAFIELVRRSGASVTFDVGHAASSAAALSGYAAADFARLVRDHVRSAHVYEREDPHHIAPESLDNIGPALEVLLESECDWWVVELFDAQEIRRTKDMLEAFVAERTGGERT